MLLLHLIYEIVLSSLISSTGVISKSFLDPVMTVVLLGALFSNYACFVEFTVDYYCALVW